MFWEKKYSGRDCFRRRAGADGIFCVVLYFTTRGVRGRNPPKRTPPRERKGGERTGSRRDAADAIGLGWCTAGRAAARLSFYHFLFYTLNQKPRDATRVSITRRPRPLDRRTRLRPASRATRPAPPSSPTTPPRRTRTPQPDPPRTPRGPSRRARGARPRRRRLLPGAAFVFVFVSSSSSASGPRNPFRPPRAPPRRRASREDLPRALSVRAEAPPAGDAGCSAPLSATRPREAVDPTRVRVRRRLDARRRRAQTLRPATGPRRSVEGSS